jgi:Protein of unknown function (DUF1573)/Abnormal spindle-like microcephaly-assoc'd, ASPM-SPD-2-Hydin
MKKINFLLTLLMLTSACFAKSEASIEFTTKIHDFGQITEEDGVATYDFVFKNVGEAPLVIYKAVASCGCTTPIFPQQPIAAGALATIKVSYNTSGRPGPFHKTITVSSNDSDSPNVVLVISGDVVSASQRPEDLYPKNMQGLRLNRTQISFLEAKIGSINTELIEVINTNKTPLKIAFSKVPKHIQITASNTVLKPNDKGVLTIKYLPALAKDFGKREDSFYIVTNGKNDLNPNNRINLSAVITEDFSRLSPDQRENGPKATLSNSRINFGKMIQGTRKASVLTLTNSGKLPLYIRKIVPEYDGMKILADKRMIPAGKSTNLKIDFNAGTFDGDVMQRFTIITNDPRNSVNRVFISAQVSPK